MDSGKGDERAEKGSWSLENDERSTSMGVTCSELTEELPEAGDFALALWFSFSLSWSSCPSSMELSSAVTATEK